MSTELTKENTLLLNLRVINFFISTLAIVLLVWMAIGESVLSPLCELKIFANRRESCFRNGAIEMRDRASIIILAVLTFAFIVSMKFTYIKKMIIKQNFLTSSVDKFAFVIIIAAIASRDYYPSFDDWSINEFSGLGFDVAFICTLFSILLIYLSKKIKYADTCKSNFLSIRKKISLTAFIIFVTFYFPATLQLQSSLSSRENALYVFNELLAPLAGNSPLADSIPQYNSLLGFPLIIISKFFSPEAVFAIVPIWVTALTLTIILSLSTTWVRLFPNMPKALALLGVSSIILARSSDSISAYTVASIPSWTVRFAVPSQIPLLLHLSLGTNFKYLRTTSTLGLGVVAALAVLNNFEFGISAATSVLLAIVVLISRKLINFRYFSNFLIAFVTTIFVINKAYNYFDKEISFLYLTQFARAFGSSGWGSRPMPVFGHYFVIYAIAGLTIVIALSRLSKSGIIQSFDDLKTFAADCGLAVFSGIWTMISLVFYSARSVDGNLRVIFLPALIASLATIKLIKPLLVRFFYHSDYRVTLLPLAVITVLPLVLFIKAPDPHANWNRVFTYKSNTTWSWDSTKDRAISISYYELSKSGFDQIGIMAFDGNAVSIVTGGRNVLATNVISDLEVEEELKNQICLKLKLAKVKYVLVEGAYDNFPCAGMTNPQIQANGVVTLFEYTPPALG